MYTDDDDYQDVSVECFCNCKTCSGPQGCCQVLCRQCRTERTGVVFIPYAYPMAVPDPVEEENRNTTSSIESPKENETVSTPEPTTTKKSVDKDKASNETDGKQNLHLKKKVEKLKIKHRPSDTGHQKHACHDMVRCRKIKYQSENLRQEYVKRKNFRDEFNSNQRENKIAMFKTRQIAPLRQDYDMY